MTLRTGLDSLSAMPIGEWVDTIREVGEVIDERKRIQANGKNRR
jgi:hypothetical protein